MRKVYIVIGGMDYEWSGPERVFTNRKKALSYIKMKHPISSIGIYLWR